MFLAAQINLNTSS